MTINTRFNLLQNFVFMTAICIQTNTVYVAYHIFTWNCPMCLGFLNRLPTSTLPPTAPVETVNVGTNYNIQHENDDSILVTMCNKLGLKSYFNFLERCSKFHFSIH